MKVRDVPDVNTVWVVTLACFKSRLLTVAHPASLSCRIIYTRINPNKFVLSIEEVVPDHSMLICANYSEHERYE